MSGFASLNPTYSLFMIICQLEMVLEVNGFILADQIRTMDWRVRRAEYICSLPTETVDAVLERIGVLLKIL